MSDTLPQTAPAGPVPPQDISALRGLLFDMMAALKDKSDGTAVARARAASEVAGKIIDTGKLELDFARLNKRTAGSGFVPLAAPAAGDATPAAGCTSGRRCHTGRWPAQHRHAQSRRRAADAGQRHHQRDAAFAEG